MSSSPRTRPTGWLLLSGLGWYTAACVLVAVAIDADRVVGTSSGFLGGDVLASGVGERAAVLPVLLASVVALLAAMVVLGQGWAMIPLVAAGLIEVVGLATTGSWLTLVAMLAVLVGAAPVVVRSVQDHLWAPKQGAAHVGRD